MSRRKRHFRPSRFPDRIVRLRQLEGEFNPAGEWQPGGVVEEKFRASVQPATLQDLDTVEGSRLSERIVIYVAGEDQLLAAFENAEADRVRWKGNEYLVEKSMTWTDSHTRAVALRES